MCVCMCVSIHEHVYVYVYLHMNLTGYLSFSTLGNRTQKSMYTTFLIVVTNTYQKIASKLQLFF